MELAAHYVARIRARGRAVHDDGSTYLYDATRGVFVPLASTEESCIVQSFAGSRVSDKTKPLSLRSSDIEGTLKLAHARLAVPEFFASAPCGLAFADGFVTVDADGAKLAPHSAEHRARHGYVFAFGTARAPARFLSALRETFEQDSDRDEKIALVQEFAGASLFGLAPRYQSCLVFVGEGANGKSTTIEIVQSAMPPGSVVSIPPQRWSNEYRRASLAGALMNVVGELPESDIIDGETFKTIVTGDQIDAREIYRPPFMMKPRAGHLFAANRLPGANDTTLGFWRRFIVVTFSRRFEGADANKSLAAEIIAAESPAIVRWLVDGAVRVVSQGGYTIPRSSHEAVRAWRRNANPVAIWLDEETLDDPKGTPATVLYAAFRAWCERSGHRAMSSTKFGSRMRELGKGGDRTNQGKRYPVAVTGCVGQVAGYSSPKSNGVASA